MKHVRALCVLVALLQIVPVVGAHHTQEEGEGPEAPMPVVLPPAPVEPPVNDTVGVPSEEDVDNATKTGIPLADSVRDQLLALERESLALLNATLLRFGISADLLPAANANVFRDGLDPESRTGGIGGWEVLGDDEWIIAPGVGNNSTAGWALAHETIGDEGRGKTSVLLTPAIDLSAYPLPTGTMPFVSGSFDSDGTTASACAGVEKGHVSGDTPAGFIEDQTGVSWPVREGVCTFAAPNGNFIQDQIDLIFKQKLNMVDSDGGQVRAFTEKPDARSLARDPGDLLLPMPLYGKYEEVLAFKDPDSPFQGHAFTGRTDWETVAFDVTPYAGRTIWIAFVFSSTRTPMDRSDLPDPASRGGWLIDDVEVRSPAFAQDLKVWRVQGPAHLPTFVTPTTGILPVIAPGTNASFSAVVLNAGARTYEARVEMEILFPESEPIRAQFSKNLSPGEVWAPNMSAVVPSLEAQSFRVGASAWSPGLNTGGSASRSPDPTGNNAGSAEFWISTIRGLELDVRPNALRVDDGATQSAVATVTNTGNVPVTAVVTLDEEFNDADGEATIERYQAEPFALQPGETEPVEFVVTTQTRGEHRLVANASFAGDEDVVVSQSEASYYVHASPPPLYESGARAPADRSGWTTTPAIPLPPSDEWVWATVVKSWVDPTARNAIIGTFAAAPKLCDSGVPSAGIGTTPCVPQTTGKQDKFDRLQLTLRYATVFGTGTPSDGLLSIVYTAPAPAVVQSKAPQTVWSYPLDVDLRISANGKEDLSREMVTSTWVTLSDVPVRPSSADGYVDFWSLQGLEVRVSPPLHDMSFYIDELKLTAVPAGEDESSRIVLIHVTGDPEADENVVTPSVCRNPGQEINCWRAQSTEDLLAAAPASQWKVPPSSVPGNPLFMYGSDAGQLPNAARERLVSPEIFLRDAEDPVIVLDHAYFFDSYPQFLNAIISQIGYVEFQYRNDDGSWSDMVRLVPEGGYPSPLHKSPDNATVLTPTGSYDNNNNEVGSYGASADGFYHPPPCLLQEKAGTNRCDQGGYMKGQVRIPNTNPPQVVNVWRDLPSPRQEQSVFKLSQVGVDLSNRGIRFAFHTPGITVNHFAYWLVQGVRVTAFPDFAVDGAIEEMTLDTPYDWTTLGVGPGMTVETDVTVRNLGIYPQSFDVTLNARRGSGELNPVSEQARTGLLAPGASKPMTVSWRVPEEEGVNYTLVAVLTPSDEGVLDEFPTNDNASIGEDGLLVARTRRDISVSAAITPVDGTPGLVRHISIRLSNEGNVPVTDVTVSRSILQMTAQGTRPAPGGLPVSWRVEEIPVGTRDMDLAGLADDFAFEDLEYVAQDLGSYVLDVRAEASEPTLHPDLGLQKLLFKTLASIYSDGFEAGSFWQTSDNASWKFAPGVEGGQALAVAGPAVGVLPASLDTVIESPPLPLADARSATVSLVSKFNLEPGYDGARVEISTPDGWVPLMPLGFDGTTGPYPANLTSGNPLSNGTFPLVTTALTGDSRQDPAARDGWIPYSFDLSQVKAFQELVPLQKLVIPGKPAGPLQEIPNAPHTLSAPWLRTGLADEHDRWEVRNEGDADGLIMDAWWSGMTSVGQGPSLTRTLDVSAQSLPEGEDLFVTWWEHRPGTKGSDWRGVGAFYEFSAADSVAGTVFDARLDQGRVQLLARNGTWSLVGASIPSSKFARAEGETLTLSFSTRTPADTVAPTDKAHATNTGWLVSGVEVFAGHVENGVVKAVAPLTGEPGTEAEQALWSGWQRVCMSPIGTCGSLPPRSQPWLPVLETGPEGLEVPMWKLSLPSGSSDNVDVRVVSPVVDLTKTTGTRVLLDLVHKYDFYFKEDNVPSNSAPWMSKWYQGGVVEIQQLDEATGEWGPWVQAFSDAGRPPEAMSSRDATSPPAVGAPYDRVFLDAGDTFERFPRHYNQTVRISPTIYRKNITANLSYAFSGKSLGEPALRDFEQTTFDLTPFAGHRVRIGFHAWTGKVGAVTTPPANTPFNGHWTIASATVLGNVLDAGTPKLRVHLGTDASILEGSFAVDEVSIAGIRNARSVGIQLEEQPTRALSNGTLQINGTLGNFGPSGREGLALGISVSSLSTGLPVPVDLNGQRQVALQDGLPFQRAIELLPLTPAGSANDSRAFNLTIFTGSAGEDIVVKLQALEAIGAVYVPVSDDVPARASREWKISVTDQRQVLVKTPLASPPTLAGPGDVWANVTIRNDGTLPLSLFANFTLQPFWKREVPPVTSVRRTVAPGSSVLATAKLQAPSVGNYNLTVLVSTEDGQILGTSISLLRVGTNDTLLSESFEGGWSGWTRQPGYRLESGGGIFNESIFGSTSVLFGVNDSEFANGSSLGDGQTGLLTSPRFRIPDLGPHATFAFWERAQMRGSVQVHALLEDLPTGCETGNPFGSNILPLWSEIPLTQSIPQLRRVPLDSLAEGCWSGSSVQFQILVADARDRGVRFDGITITTSEPEVRPILTEARLTDSASKEYAFEIANPGSATRTFNVSLDTTSSRLSREQQTWINLTPATLTLAPGERALGRLLVDTPTAAGQFAEPLRIQARIAPQDAPFDNASAVFDLDFQPQARPDLSARVSIDGQPVASGLGVEAQIPHEVTAVVTNVGSAPSLPTVVEIEVVDADRGVVVWNDTQAIDRPLVPSVGGEDAYIVSTQWTPPGNLGKYVLRIVIDPLRRQVDYDRSNDDLALPVEVIQLRRPDLVLDPSTAKLTTPDGRSLHESTPGALVHIQAIVRNEGFADATGAVARIIAGSSVLKEEPIGTLRINDSVIVEANHIAPASTVSYRVVVFTPEPELSLSNNAVSLTLPVYPPDIRLEEKDAITLAPGDRASIGLNVTDAGPYPLLVNLSILSGGGLASVSTASLPLAPNETARATIDVDLPETTTAGRHLLVVRAAGVNGEASQRTIPIDVLPRPGAAIRMQAGALDPRRATLDVTVENTGNVQVPILLEVTSNGAVLGTFTTKEIAVGASAIATVPLDLPPDHAPGPLDVVVSASHGGAKLAGETVSLAVAAWGEVSRDPAQAQRQENGTYTMDLRFDGNRAFSATPRLEGLPAGARVTFESSVLDAAPGEASSLRFVVASSPKTPSGLYSARLRFVDAEAGSERELGAIPLTLDLRRENLTLLSTQRVARDLEPGTPQEWRVQVRNVGDKAARDVPVELYVDEVLVARVTLGDLAPGDSARTKVTWNATPGAHTALVVVRSGGEIAKGQAFADAFEVSSSGLSFATDRKVPAGGMLPLAALAVAAVLVWGWRRRAA